MQRLGKGIRRSVSVLFPSISRSDIRPANTRCYIMLLIGASGPPPLSEGLDGVYGSAGMSRAACNQAQGKWLIPLVMTPARQAQQFSSADTDQ